jgi:hypothetical protein
MQKLKYIHENPVKAGLCAHPLEYKYSSAMFYHTGTDNWGFLTHIRDWLSLLELSSYIRVVGRPSTMQCVIPTTA